MSPPSSADGKNGTIRREHAVQKRRVLIVDKQRLFAEALGHALMEAGHEKVQVASSRSEALTAVRTLRPDVAIVGEGLSDPEGQDIMWAIVSELPGCRVIVLVDEGQIVPEAGTGTVPHGVVSTTAPASQFVRAIDDCLEGRSLPRVHGSPTHSDAPAADPWIGTLTDREAEVLYLLACGATSEEIAMRFRFQVNTARKHVQNILTKLQVHSRLEAVAVAIRTGIVDPNQIQDRGSDPIGTDRRSLTLKP